MGSIAFLAGADQNTLGERGGQPAVGTAANVGERKSWWQREERPRGGADLQRQGAGAPLGPADTGPLLRPAARPPCPRSHLSRPRCPGAPQETGTEGFHTMNLSH